MLLDIYNLLAKIQTGIGDKAEVRLTIESDGIVFRVDWWEEDYHARYKFTLAQLAQVKDDNILIDFLIDRCKYQFDASHRPAQFDIALRSPAHA